ncbi:hypothetical protein [Streptomyces sp. NPDC003032]
MTQPTPTPARICRNCDGFASVKVTLGGLDRHGHRRLVTAHCKTCHGTGTTRARRFDTAHWAVAA